MEPPDIEYIDSVDRGSSLRGDSEVGPGLGDARLASILGVIGWLVVAAAIVVAIGLAIAYRPSHGDPMRPVPTDYTSERGVPPAADLVLGTVGVVLGLGLVAFGRLLVHSATTAAQVTAIAGLLAERPREPDGTTTSAGRAPPDR